MKPVKPIAGLVIAIAAIAAIAATAAAPVNASAQDKGTHHAAAGSGHSTHAGMDHGGMQMESSPNAANAPFDLQFIDTMVLHHQSAVDMAALVEARSAHDELKQLAKKMARDQQEEIQRLQAWKKQWYAGRADAVNMQMPGMAESMKDMPMDKLQAARGDEFDAMFIDMMTRHHRGAVTMAEDAQNKARHAEIKSFARSVIREQKKEIAQMAGWKKQWKLTEK